MNIIKVCGITNLDDALRSIALGANALGFNFYRKSPRYMEPQRAQRIIEKLPNSVLCVGVFVWSTAIWPLPHGRGSAVSGQLSVVSCQLSALQLHGLSAESDVPKTNERLFIATSPSLAPRFPNYELIIDTSWGRGKKADWEKLRDFKRPYILSGGLTSQNVSEAIRLLHPAGVDVCTGVESSPGKKDPAKLKRFLESALRAYEKAKTA